MISKVYEDKYGLIKWNCITSDLEVAKTDSIYLADKATGSLIINIQEPSNSLIWDNENKEWIPYSVNGGGISDEEVKTLAGEKINELVNSGELKSQIITDKSINANEKIIDGTITKELLDDNIKLEISGNIETIVAVDETLNLRKGNLYANIQNNTTINLPNATEYMEIRLWFKCTEDLSIVFPAVCWQNEPKTYAGYIYEYIFTYVNGDWVGGFVSYEVV